MRAQAVKFMIITIHLKMLNLLKFETSCKKGSKEVRQLCNRKRTMT